MTIETGALNDLPPADELLAWGESPRIAALRRRGPAAGGAGGEEALSLPLAEAVWRLPPADPVVVARVAHRGFAFELARERGWALPGAGLAEDVAELERRVEALGEGPWVAKGAYSAAGRERVFGAGRGDLRALATRRRLETLLERHGTVLVEPWVERTADFGCAGLVAAAGARLLTLHGQQVDARGVFRGIVPLPSDFLPLPATERERLEHAFHAAAEHLRAAGYRGPFGIDAFRWRRRRRPRGAGETQAFHPLVEINPRLTFGLVARAEAERVERIAAGGTGREGGDVRMNAPEAAADD